MMKKKCILIFIAAVVVLCAVICTAGCVNSADDNKVDVLGTWFHGDDKLEVIISLNEDGTGMIACFKDDDDVLMLGVPVPYVNDVLWDAEGDSLSVLFDNGAATLYTIDTETGKLTSEQFGVVYRPIHAPKVEDAKLNPVGTWYTDDGNFEGLLIFLKDGTGAYACLKDEKNEHNTHSAAGFALPLVWSGANGIVKVTLDGGEILGERTLSGAIDLVTGNLFTSHHTVYERVSPSELAGKFVGTWHFDNGQFAGILVVAEDNTGVFICLKDETGRYGNNDALPHHELFVWDEKEGTLTDHYEDGSIVTAVIDKKTGKLVDSFNTAYERVSTSEPAGQFIGTWYFDDGKSLYLLLIGDDGKGMFVCLKDDAGKYQSSDALPQYERFVWDEKEGTLNDHYEDGSIVTAVIDKKTGKLVDSFDTAYERIGMSESAGQFVGTWYFDDGKSTYLLLIGDDGKGMFVRLKDDAGKSQSSDALPPYELFVWDEKDGTLNDYYEDGSLVTAVIDKKTGKLVDSFNTAYERII